jgi:uncharacterized membrane protein YfcA
MPGLDLAMGELLAFAAAAIAVGAFAGILAGVFGIGGGAVLVPIFFQALGVIGVEEQVRMHLAVGTSLAVIVPTSLSSLRAHYRRGAVDMELLRSFLISVPAGVVLGSLTAAIVSGGALRLVFAVFAVALGLRLLFNRDSWRLGNDIPGNPVRGLFGLLVGYLSTLMGIGGGVINNTFMMLYGRSIHQAVATSAGMGVLISIPGVIGYVWAGMGVSGLPIGSTGYVNWIAVALIIPITFFTAPLGARIAHALSRRMLEIAFGIFLLLVAARFVASLF